MTEEAKISMCVCMCVWTVMFKLLTICNWSNLLIKIGG